MILPKGEYSMAFIEFNDVKKAYQLNETSVYALDGITTSIGKGQICVILGPSGSGKSTFLNVLGGLDSIDTGTIKVDGQSVDRMTSRELSVYRRDNLGFIFQFYNLIPNLTVEENVRVCEYLAKNKLDYKDLMSILGIDAQRKKFPSQLSGGQQQRCSIARALVKNPKVLLCDEPTGALDSVTSKEILKLLEKINSIYGTTICIVTHNTAIKEMAHKVIYIRDGKITSSYENEKRISAADIEF